MRRGIPIVAVGIAACLGDPTSTVGLGTAELDGVWRASWTHPSGISTVATLEITQTRREITGLAYVQARRHTITGNVSGDSSVTIAFAGEGAGFTFDGRVDGPARLVGRVVGYHDDPVAVVFLRQADPAAPFVRVAGTWESSWSDADNSWSMTVTLDQISEQLIVTGGALTRMSQPPVEVGLDGGSGGDIDGTVGTQAGVIFSLISTGNELGARRFSFEGRLTSPTTLQGALLDFSQEGSVQPVTMRR